jgi:PKD repeat protein
MAPTRMEKLSSGRERAASEVIGAILLVSVVVVAVAVIGVALTSQGTPQKIPALDAVISNYGSTIQIYHNGGDTLQKADMAILVDGQEKSFSKGSDPSWTSWSAGDSLVYTVPGGDAMPKIVNIVFRGAGASTVLTTADFSATGLINEGPLPTQTPDLGPVQASFTGIPVSGTAPLAVQFTGSSTGTPTSWSWAFGDGGTSLSQSPLYTYANAGTYSPSLTVSNGTGSDTLTRTNYITVSPGGPVADFTGSPLSGPPPLVVSFTDTSTGSPTIWNWSFGDGSFSNLANPPHTYSSLGTYTVSLNATNAGGSNTMTKTNYITVTYSAPTVTSITPNSSAQTTPVSVTVGGTGFLSGANVTLVRSGYPTITATSVSVGTSTSITCQFNLATATAGQWDVTVQNLDGQSGTLPAGFTVKNPKPAVTAITPATGIRGWPVTITNLAGNNFVSGATVKLVNNSAGPDVTAYDVVRVSSTMITCKFNLLSVNASRWNVTVTNPSSDPGVLQNGFTVTSLAPTITGNSAPPTGIQGQLVTITNLPGTNYQPGAVVDYYRGGTRINLTNVNVVSATQLSGTLQIPANAPTGPYSVSVMNSDGRSGTRTTAGTFTVNSNAPTVTSRSNATLYRIAWPGFERITGTNFVSGATSVLNRTSGESLASTSCEFRSSTELFCTYNPLLTPAFTGYRVAVINPDGKSGLMTTNTVTVSNPVNPTVTAITPASGQRGTTVTITNIAGTNFQPGVTQVRFTTNTGTTNQILLTNINVESSTKISGTLVIPAGQLTTTDYYVRVTNADATTGISGSRIFRVTV